MEYKIISPPIFKGRHLRAFFTTKSTGAEIKNISRISAVPVGNIYLPIQKHTDAVQVVEHDLGPKIADAVVTNRKGIMVGVQVADCVPLLLYDRRLHIVGAVHAGWRGTAAGILKNTIKTVMDRFYSSPSDIVIAIGPSIKQCSYAVDHEVVRAVQNATGPGDYFIGSADKYYLDLPEANKYQALSIGIPEKNIWLSEDCTFCNPDIYYSYRFARGTTGRQGAFIGLI